jgi:protein-tyrosine sulfotransferase
MNQELASPPPLLNQEANSITMTRLRELTGPASKFLCLVSSSRTKHPLHRGEPFSPFFIIGSGRCGTTLLRRVLMAHDDIYIPPETYELGQAVRTFERYSDLPWDVICRLVLSHFILSEGFEFFDQQAFRPCFLRLRDTPDSKRSLALIVNEVYRHLGSNAAPHFKLWGDKTPINAFHLKEIDSVFPHAKYIHIVRDGCDVVYSFLAMKRFSDIAKAAERWTRAVTQCHDFGMTLGNRFTEIRYEQLVTDPERVIASICDFIGVPFDTRMIYKVPDKPLGDVETLAHHLNVMGTISPASIGKGRTALTPEQRDMLHGRISDCLKLFGYPPVIG